MINLIVFFIYQFVLILRLYLDSKSSSNHNHHSNSTFHNLNSKKGQTKRQPKTKKPSEGQSTTELMNDSEGNGTSIYSLQIQSKIILFDIFFNLLQINFPFCWLNHSFSLVHFIYKQQRYYHIQVMKFYFSFHSC